MTEPCKYMTEPWFSLLQTRCVGTTRASVAKMLGISGAALSQVLNGSGRYGTGEASTTHIAVRVEHTFGRYPCPHLTSESGGDPQLITADRCRATAHCPPPTGSPRAMQHWQACRQCPHFDASAPPVPRAVQPRKVIPITAQPSTPATTPEACDV